VTLVIRDAKFAATAKIMKYPDAIRGKAERRR
jgi:hypothetical protein